MGRAESDRREEFEFLAREAFTISGRGTVVPGHVMSGAARTGDPLVLRRLGGPVRTTRALGVEHLRGLGLLRLWVGILVEDIAPEDVRTGDLLRAPEFDAQWGEGAPAATLERREIEGILDGIPYETETEIVRLPEAQGREEAIALLRATAPLTDEQVAAFLTYHGPLRSRAADQAN